MCRVASPSHFPSPVIVAFLLGLLTFPAIAQTSSDSNTPSIGTAGARAQSAYGWASQPQSSDRKV